MARKGLLSASMNRTLAGDGESSGEVRSSSPNVRRFRETFEDLRAQSIQEIDTDLIGDSRYRDRFDANAEIAGLVESIREAGQQIPVLLRRKPGTETEFEPVYGRRRIAACRILGIPVRALLGDLDDEQTVVAQGLENNERLDNSFIEKAVFVQQLRDGGMRPKVIDETLGIPAAEISRMSAVLRDTPDALIDAIGPAHGVGRRQWVAFADLAAKADAARIDRAVDAATGPDISADRFQAALAVFKNVEKPPPSPDPRPIADNRVTLTPRGSSLTVTVGTAEDRAFLDWLAANGEDLYLKWRAGDV